jgi:hypothetical protein
MLIAWLHHGLQVQAKLPPPLQAALRDGNEHLVKLLLSNLEAQDMCSARTRLLDSSWVSHRPHVPAHA